uniref:Uncharacterized protein n=1 Tax=Panagrolaimus sp. JU765 TaxID=591449 RepID=A0AC34RN60_9BILA
MKLVPILFFFAIIGQTLAADDQLASCRAQLENVHNQATIQIKNLTDIIQEYVEGVAKNATLGEVLKQKMQAYSANIKTEWNNFGNTLKTTFTNLGGTISNAWQNIFNPPTTTPAPTIRPGVTIPSSPRNNFMSINSNLNFWKLI